MRIFQIQIALKGFRPKIWRRILVPENVLLPDFHKIIQTTMGWTNSHLHHFVKGRSYYVHKTEDDVFVGNNSDIDYAKIKISDLLSFEKDKIIYEYDFGDDWEHDIVLEKILPYDTKLVYPICVKGKMNCPPEDCGGVWGYADMLEVLKDPEHEDYEELRDWLGEEFDPQFFDIDTVNELLKRKDFGCLDLFY
ncbi:MAG TPA: plasmid pRiA4b ORF-3 family protein [Bacteroidales bacterium]|nr:plasmid pRiA4b ORF-3 family protein [Bacteroidales bacterium]HQB20899.1 plasmid pRiA4b ORF-3 family protein [Bacteroidales bacterium]